MQIKKITDPDLKSECCNFILRSLPLWFGIESAIVDYVKDVRSMETWVAYEGETTIGFASINQHFPKSAEIHVMGILNEYHRRGIGHQLIESIEKDLRSLGVRFLTVKTLSESRANEEYSQTRNFYLNVGFTPLEEFKTLWGAENPCLLLVKNI
jgi:N-acetylglutamate synthase-like GNAT family acetyltransferase